jgi:hypothetical protein
MSLSLNQIRDVLGLVDYPGYAFQIHGGTDGKPMYLQAAFEARCSVSGLMETQHTRKWLLSPHMTPSEVVQTALKCVLTSVEHEAREQFRYRGQAIFGPHFSVEDLVRLAQAGRLDARPAPARGV